MYLKYKKYLKIILNYRRCQKFLYYIKELKDEENITPEEHYCVCLTMQAGRRNKEFPK